MQIEAGQVSSSRKAYLSTNPRALVLLIVILALLFRFGIEEEFTKTLLAEIVTETLRSSRSPELKLRESSHEIIALEVIISSSVLFISEEVKALGDVEKSFELSKKVLLYIILFCPSEILIPLVALEI